MARTGVEVALGPYPPPPPSRMPPVRRGPTRRLSIKGLLIPDGCRGVGEGVGGGVGGGRSGEREAGGPEWGSGVERRDEAKRNNSKRKKNYTNQNKNKKP